MTDILIIDPKQASPSLYHVLKTDGVNIDYVTLGRSQKSRYGDLCGDYTQGDFEGIYGLKYDISIPRENYDYVFILFPFLDFDVDHNSKNYLYIECFENFYFNVKNICKKLFLVDIHPYAYDPSFLLEKYTYNVLFKRVCSKSVKYSDKVVPYPFILFGYPEPIYKLITAPEMHDKKYPGIFWAGNLFVSSQPKYNVSVNRKKTMSELLNVTDKINVYSRLGFHQYMSTMSDYKYFLDLRGESPINKRFFEGISVGSLCLGEYHDTIWPFEDGDDWPKLVFFKNSEDFVTNLEKLERDINIYNDALDAQNKIIKKYFNKTWLRKYIYKFI